MALTFKEVAEILKLIDASECEEVVLELEGTRLVVRRSAGGTPLAPRAETSTAPASSATPSSAAPVPPPRSEAPARPGAAGLTEIRAPMVGTFYRRPSPEETPFVEVGARVAAGDPVCLIEVMKLYTTIEAPVAGVVEAIEADDAALVEFDQLLFLVRPD